MPYRRREGRDRERARRAAAAARTKGQSALDVALAEIGAAFDQSAVINGFKIRVERLIRRGPHHPALRARFGARATRLSGRDLEAAVAIVERWWRDERKAFQIASALGGGSRLSLEVLYELRLVLRLMRLKRMEAEYCEVIAALRDWPRAAAAE
ncbi:MAG TPA: hypothetical protein VK749_15705 [Xanthobacteraceae bacterium]|jgi:hypothetical protein|nr:hypothetical protein [Xanthobacteraceae bacterium]